MRAQTPTHRSCVFTLAEAEPKVVGLGTPPDFGDGEERPPAEEAAEHLEVKAEPREATAQGVPHLEKYNKLKRSATSKERHNFSKFWPEKCNFFGYMGAGFLGRQK